MLPLDSEIYLSRLRKESKHVHLNLRKESTQNKTYRFFESRCEIVIFNIWSTDRCGLYGIYDITDSSGIRHNIRIMAASLYLEGS